MKILLKQNLEIEDFAVLSTETEAEIQQFVGEFNLENFDYLLLSESARQVAVYIAGYITHKLMKITHTDNCLVRLKEGQVTSPYVDTLNRGGLNLPSMSNSIITSKLHFA